MNRGSKLACVGWVVAASISGCGAGAENGGTGGGTGGQAPTGAGGSAPTCDGTVAFRLDAAPDDGFFAQQAYPECWGENWLKIFDVSGREQRLIFPGTSLDCGSCSQTIWSEICTTSTVDPVRTATWVWDGHMFAPGSCGGGATCARQACAPAGHYFVTMCGTAGPELSSALRCVQAPFDYPTGEEVAATLPPPSHD